MTPVVQEAPDRFRVDLGAVRAGWLGRVVAAATPVDPLAVAMAVREVLALCKVRSAAGRKMAWNEYRVFLNRADLEMLRPLESKLAVELDGLLRKDLAKRKADLVGALTVRLQADEGGDLAPGSATVRVAFVPTDALAAPGSGEVTIRVGRSGATAVPGSTERVGDTSGALRVTWAGGEASVSARTVFGRPHEGASGPFVPLSGASARVSKRHVWVEPAGAGAVVGRLSTANPVQVNGRAVQPGGKLAVDALPVEVSLSNGDLVLRLERSGAA